VFDHIRPLDPKTEKLKRALFIAIPMVLLLSGYGYYLFRNFSEETVVRRFMTALVQEDYEKAYETWQPSRFYRFRDFRQDWGHDGLTGPITDYAIVRSRRRGTGVIVIVLMNNRQEFGIWVERETKRLSFPP
jgi:hypothetical protein